LRVLLITQHYAPEVTSSTLRMQAFAEGLVGLGHEVEVICEVPNHPSGIVAEGYRGQAVVRRSLGGVDVRYVWVRAREEKTKATRLALYGTFAAAALAAGLAGPRPDVVMASSPPLTAAAPAPLVARRHRVPWVFDVRDLWPEAAVILGELNGRPAIRAAELLERTLYRSADAIVTVTHPFRDDITAKAPEASEVVIIPNGTTSAWIDAGAREPDRNAAGLSPDEFVWAYAGNLGIAQGLDAAIEAAAQLGDGYRLLLIGTGPRLTRLRELAESNRAANVEFRGLLEQADAAATLRACDALLVPLAADPAWRKYVPSKLFDACAIGRPVIVSAAGEPQRLSADAGAALAVPPEDPAALTKAVRTLRSDPDLGARLSSAGRDFAAGSLRERGTERLEELLVALTAGNRR
jgi:colanic acid biosynthesis glycosyl transferase WcaI